MRCLTIFLLSFLILGCGPTASTDQPTANPNTAVDAEPPAQNEEAPDDDMTSHEPKISEVEEPGATDPMTAIRKEYARIEAALAAGTLRKDSISYYCENTMADGRIDLYSDASGVVLTVNGYSQGDHYGTTEHYYYRDGQPVFLFREIGTWQFGGEMRIMDDGMEVPGTIDNITEDRLYFHKGSTIKALTKEYEIKNGEDVDPSTIPNKTMAHNGEMPGSLGFIQSAVVTKKVDCKLMEEL
jgi:hypothetical protein